MKIVTIGGGGGHKPVIDAIMLLRQQRPQEEIHLSCIMTTLDSGGSSGELRKHTGICVGDLRVGIAALAEPALGQVFNTRVARNGGAHPSIFDGHAIGNLVIAALLEQFDDPQEALDHLHMAFHLKGQVLPITFMPGDVFAALGDGSCLDGEDAIYKADIVNRGGLKKLWISPELLANRKALKAIAEADYIIFCAGTLWCSIVPPILIPGVKEALLQSKAKRLCVTNIVNRDGHMPPHATVMDHVGMIEDYLCRGFFNYVLYNTGTLLPELASLFALEGKTAGYDTGSVVNDRVMIGHPFLDPEAMVARVEEYWRVQDNPDQLKALRSPVQHAPHLLAEPLGWILR